MSHQQKRHERHEHDRKAKQARRRQATATFSRPGQSLVTSRHVLVVGAVACGIVVVLWVIVTRL